MESRSFALIVGFFMIGFVVAITLTFRWLERSKTPQAETYHIQSDISVAGLRENADVKMKGIVVGSIVAFHFYPDNQDRILITILVDSDIRLTHATFARVKPIGIMGQFAIELVEDPDLEPKPLQHDPNHRIEMRPSELHAVATDLWEFFNHSQQLLTQLDKLASDENIKTVSDVLANLERSFAELPALFVSVEKTSNTLHRTLGNIDDIVVKDGTSIVQSLRETSNDIQQLATEVRKFAQSMNQEMSQVVGDLRQDMLPNINRTLSGLEQTSDRIDRMIDQFSNNPGVLIRGVESRPGPGETGFEKGGR